MSISNYGELKDAASVYMFHQRFVPQYDNATTIFEQTANSRLRVRQMETSVPLTTVDGEVTIPSDYLLWRTVLSPADTPPELGYVHPAYLDAAGGAKVFAIEGNLFKTRPKNDAVNAYQFHYYQKIPSIVSATPTVSNWLIVAYPSLYLFGVLAELFALGRNLEAAQLYKARRDEIFAEVIQLSALTTGASSPAVREDPRYF